MPDALVISLLTLIAVISSVGWYTTARNARLIAQMCMAMSKGMAYTTGAAGADYRREEGEEA